MKFALTILLVAAVCLAVPQCAFADVQQQLQDQVEEGLGNLDFAQMEQLSQPFFGGFLQKVRQIINGQFNSVQSFWQLVCQLFGQNFRKIVPHLVTIFCLLVVCGLLRHTADGLISADTNNVVSFVCVAAITLSALGLCATAYAQVWQMVTQTALLADAAMPILLTLLVANGGSVSSSVCQPSMVMFSSVVINVVKNVLLPASVFALTFSVVSNVSANVRVEKMSALLHSGASWLLGAMFTLFSAFTSVQGVTAAGIDGVSFRAAKFAAKNYIPILGGYLADGFDVVVAATSLIKNAFGGASMLLMFFVALQPLVTLVCANLGLQAVAAISQPVTDEKFVKILHGISKSLTFLTALVFAVLFMFCILAFVAISCANFV